MREARAPRLHQASFPCNDDRDAVCGDRRYGFGSSLLTPIGHHGNLLVYGPGRYQFADFVKVGTPLTVICALIVVLLAPLIWQG